MDAGEIKILLFEFFEILDLDLFLLSTSVKRRDSLSPDLNEVIPTNKKKVHVSQVPRLRKDGFRIKQRKLNKMEPSKQVLSSHSSSC